MIRNEPALFTPEQIQEIEKIKSAKYVCTTEKDDICIEIFYGDTPHPDSGSRYFGLYKGGWNRELYITDGSFVEDQLISAVIADNGDIVYSRYRHDYRSSPDGSVWIDGGRAYTRRGLYPKEKHCTLVVREGVLQVKQE
jgi:hypothetical protein